MKKQLLLLGLSLGLFMGNAYSQDCTGNRYKESIFTNIGSELDVQYGSNFGQNGTTNVDLFLDIYYPEGDTDTDRPLILLAHGGSFIGGNKSDMAVLCQSFASRGYVAVSMQYRLLTNLFDPEVITNTGFAFKKEVVRAYHDMKAAVRFFKKSAENGNPYGINADYIVVGGVSAGAILANHVTYMDDISKVPADLTAYVTAQGGIEGNSGNAGFSSETQMSMSWCGAILDTTFMDAGAQPYIGFHTEGDQTVPNLEGTPNIGMNVPVVLQGDSLMYVRAQNVNLTSFYKMYPGNEHCGFPMEETFEMASDFLYDEICGQSLAVGENQNTVLFSIYPNPASESFFVDIPGNSSDWSVSVVNMVGQTVYGANMDSFNNRIEVPSINLEAGIYLVQLKSKDGKKATKKVVIQ